MPKVQLGIVGGGGIAGLHLSGLDRLKDEHDLVGIADVREEAARTTADRFGAKMHTTDYRELLHAGVDAVLVCVPTFLHAEVAAAALRAGKHVFCEKPLARTLEQAALIEAAAAGSGAQFQVGFVRRFDEEWLAFRQAVLAGDIGRPVVWHDVANGAGPSAPWFCIDEQGGGPFLDGCIHNIDFALYTFGPAEWAFAHLRTYRPGGTALDTGTATIHFHSGDELLLAWSWGLPQGCSGTRVFELMGPRGIISWPRAENPSGTGSFVINTGEEKRSVIYPSNALMTGFEQEMREFFAAVRGDIKPRAGLKEGIASLKVALAILESGRSGKVTPIKE